jgi:copper chaperone CopZ
MGLFSRAEEFEFKVSGMDCGGCENKIIRTLTGIRGVKKVEASASQGSVSVTSKGVDSVFSVRRLRASASKSNDTKTLEILL